DEDAVRLEGLGATVGEVDDDARGAVQASTTADDLHTGTLEAGGDVGRLLGGQGLDPVVDLGQVDAHVRQVGLLRLLVEGDAQVDGVSHLVHDLGGRDQRLAGDAVGEDGGAAQAVGVDHDHLGAQLGGDVGCFVATRATPDDDHSVHVVASTSS